MARIFNTALSALINSQEFDEAVVVLITISGVTETFRFARGYEAIISQSRTFNPADFSVGIPNEEQEVPSVAVSIAAGDTDLLAFLRTEDDPPTALVEYALRSDTNDIQMAFEYQIKEYQMDKEVIRLTLAYEPILDIAFPRDQFSPRLFPAIF